MNFKTNLRILIFLAVLSIACNNNDDEPATPVEERIITTMSYSLMNNTNSKPLVFSFRDLDGVGGDDPVISIDTLAANTIYFGNFELLNESVSPVENMLQLVDAEKEDHQFFFNPLGVDIEITYADVDADQNPVGLFTAFRTGGPGEGTLSIFLKRDLNKFGGGVAQGDINNAGGITDIQAVFPVVIR